MNKYFFITVFMIGSISHASHKRKDQGSFSSNQKHPGLRYGQYNPEKTLKISSHTDDNLSEGITGIAPIRHTPWLLAASRKGKILAMNTRTMKTSMFLDEEHRTLLQGPISITSGHKTNTIALGTWGGIFVGTFTEKEDSYSYNFAAPEELDSMAHTVVFDPSDNTLASGHDDGTVRIWDINRGQQTIQIGKPHGVSPQRKIPVFTLAYLNAYVICYNSSLRGIEIRDLRSKNNETRITVFDHQHNSQVYALATSMPHQCIISGGADGGVIVRNMRATKYAYDRLQTTNTSPVTNLRYDLKNSKRFWVGQESGGCRQLCLDELPRPNDGETPMRGSATAHAAPVSCIVTENLPNNNWSAISSSWDGVLNFYGPEVELGKEHKSQYTREKRQRVRQGAE